MITMLRLRVSYVALVSLAALVFTSCVSNDQPGSVSSRLAFKMPRQARTDQLFVEKSYAPTNAAKIMVPYFKAASDAYGIRVAKMAALELGKTCAWIPVLAEFAAPATDEEACRRAREAGVDVVLIGQVSRCAQVATGVVHVAEAEISMSALEAETGRALWSVSHRATAHTPWTSTDSLLRRMVEEMTAALGRGWLAGGNVKAMTLKQPEGLAARPGVRRIGLTWFFPSDDAAGFEIGRKDPGQDGFRVVGRVKAKGAGNYQWLDSGLGDASTYSYAVCALSKYGLKGYGAVVSAETRGPPAGPLELSAESGQIRRIQLRWKVPEDPSVSGYVVYRSEDAGKEVLVGRVSGRTATEYLDAGAATGRLVDGAAYIYRIAACNIAGIESESSASVRAITRAGPEKVAALTTSAGLSSRVELRWEVAGSPGNVAGYIIERADAIQGPYIEIGRALGAELTGYFDRQSKSNRLVDGRKYYYRVVPFDRDEVRGEPCEPVAAATKPLPARVAGLRAESMARQIALSWDPNPEPDIVCYEVCRADNPTNEPAFIGKVGGGSNTFTDMLPGGDGVPFFYSVLAVDDDGLKSEASERIEAATLLLIRAPVDVQCKTSREEAILTWSHPEPEVASKYYIYSESWMARARIAETTGTTYTVRGLRRGREHQYSVTAVDTNGVESFPSTVVKFTLK